MSQVKLRTKGKNPGRGGRMDQVVLQKTVLAAFKLRCCDLEKRCGITHGMAVKMRAKIRCLHLYETQVAAMTPNELYALWYKRALTKVKTSPDGSILRQRYLEPDYKALQKAFIATSQHDGSRHERKIKKTKQMVLEEVYFTKENQERAEREGLAMYSLSNALYRWRKYASSIRRPTFRRSYQAAQRCEADFTGVKAPYLDAGGQERLADCLVMVLPASRMVYAEVIPGQDKDSVFPALCRGFKSFGGVTDYLVVDNFKAAVNHGSGYGGVLNEAMISFARFFNIDIQTARTYAGVDKGCVEAHVKIVQRYVLSEVNRRHKVRPFRSIGELNSFIKPLVEQINLRQVREVGVSRLELFKEERQYLHRPISWDFKLGSVFTQTVPQTGQITVDGHRYAVPTKWIGIKINVETEPDRIRFYHLDALIASYPKQDNLRWLSTQDGFTPQEYLSMEMFYLPQGPFLLQWAGHIGEECLKWCKETLNAKIEKAQCYRRIVKVLSLPQALVERYRTLECLIKRLNGSNLYPVSAGEIVRAWKGLTEMPQGMIKDGVYSEENHRKACLDVLYGKCPHLLWPANPDIKLTDSRDYLNGVAAWKRQYGKIAAALNGGKE